MTLILSRVVAQVESLGEKGALRYEPGFTKYVTPLSVRRCMAAHSDPGYMNRETAFQLMHFSYGKFQIMGENLYSLGYSGTIADYLNSDLQQSVMFDTFLKSREIDYTLEELLSDPAKLRKFSRRYNGSYKYGEKIVAAAQALKGL